MYIVTYSLRENETDSSQYYRDAARFADEVLAETEQLAGGIISRYSLFLEDGGRSLEDRDQPLERTREETAFELLVLGVLWQTYSGDATGLEEGPRRLLNTLVKLRSQGGTLKPGIDFIRGIAATLFLSPDLYDHLFVLEATREHLGKLLDWLEATGEFKQEVRRLRLWQEFVAGLPDEEASAVLAAALTLAAWFELRSEEVLGKYTAHVERYLNELRPDRYWCEDVIFCGRRRVEYHLNMVGAEVMNRVFRKAFVQTREKLLLLPACMRLLPSSRCGGVVGKAGVVCTGCQEGCMVSKLTKLGKEYGFRVLVVPHESSISASRGDQPFLSQDTGVIGVACVLNLISGGWMLQEMGIPAQCVLLDYCGCSSHWSREGIPTALSIERLLQIFRQDLVE